MVDTKIGTTEDTTYQIKDTTVTDWTFDDLPSLLGHAQKDGVTLSLKFGPRAFKLDPETDLMSFQPMVERECDEQIQIDKAAEQTFKKEVLGYDCGTHQLADITDRSNRAIDWLFQDGWEMNAQDHIDPPYAFSCLPAFTTALKKNLEFILDQDRIINLSWQDWAVVDAALGVLKAQLPNIDKPGQFTSRLIKHVRNVGLSMVIAGWNDPEEQRILRNAFIIRL